MENEWVVPVAKCCKSNEVITDHKKGEPNVSQIDPYTLSLYTVLQFLPPSCNSEYELLLPSLH